MEYHSVSELYGALDAARRRLERSVARLSPAQESYKPAPGRWSVAELVEHIAASEERIVGLFTQMLARAEAENLRRAEGAAFPAVSLARFAERSREKFEAPAPLRPRGAAPVSESLGRLAASSAAIRSLRTRFEEYDCAPLRYPHPAFGPLDLYEWLAFVSAHEHRHVTQIEALKETPGFPAGADEGS